MRLLCWLGFHDWHPKRGGVVCGWIRYECRCCRRSKLERVR